MPRPADPHAASRLERGLESGHETAWGGAPARRCLHDRQTIGEQDKLRLDVESSDGQAVECPDATTGPWFRQRQIRLDFM